MTFKWDNFDLGNFSFTSKTLPWAQIITSREPESEKQISSAWEFTVPQDYPQAPTSHARLASSRAELLGLGKGRVAPWRWKAKEATRELSFQKTGMTSLSPLGGRTAVLAAETTRESVDRCDVVYLGKNTCLVCSTNSGAHHGERKWPGVKFLITGPFLASALSCYNPKQVEPKTNSICPHSQRCCWGKIRLRVMVTWVTALKRSWEEHLGTHLRAVASQS